MQGRLVGSREALSAGWKAFKEYAWVLIGVFIIDLIISYVAGRNTIAHYVFGVFIAGPVAGGVTIVSLRAIRYEYPSVGDLFAGFRDYLRWLYAYWLLIVIFLVSDIPTAIAAVIVSGVGGLRHFHGLPPTFDFAAFTKSSGASTSAIHIMNAGSVISPLVLFFLLIRYGFAYYELADGSGVVESLRKSARLTQGIRLRLLGRGAVLAGFAIAGLAACGVGIIVTVLVAQLAFVYIYTQLKGETEVAVSQSAGLDGAQDLTTWSIGRRMRTAKRPRRDV